jgi:septum formation topological specificity factor MinE
MPPLIEQHKLMETFTAPFTVLRLLTPLKISYEAAKKRAEPYTKIVGELPEMRRDTVELIRKAVTENRRAYVLVNNRSEGNAPLTVSALRDSMME